MSLAEQFHSGLVGSHAVISITLDRILSITGGPSPGEDGNRTAEGMHAYMTALLAFVDAHHRHEDAIFFPFFVKMMGDKWNGDGLTKEHEQLHAKLVSLRQRLAALQPSQVSWDDLRALLVDFEGNFVFSPFFFPSLFLY